MTQIQRNIDAAVAVLVAKTGLTELQARALVLDVRAKLYTPPPVWRNTPRMTEVSR